MKKQLLCCVLFLASINYLFSQTPELWGLASFGGASFVGTIMKINGDGSGFSPVFSFSLGSGIGPVGNLIPINSSSAYGMTAAGGTYLLGDLYRFNFSTNTYTSLFSFDSSSGFYPRGSLLLASNSKLYGMTSVGGAYNKGVLFGFDPSNNSYTKLHDFDSITGYFPLGSVIEHDGKLYGMTTAGGASVFGLIFSFDFATNTFADLHDFNFTDGASPFGSLIEGNDHKLYGMAFGGGTTGYGVIFRLDPSDNSYTMLYNFDKTDGSAPTGNLVQGSENMYGMTSQGGTNNLGVIFRFDPSNSTFTKLHDFAAATGASPPGSPIIGSDGKLYGMTQLGGANSVGVIFSLDLVSNAYIDMHDCEITGGEFPLADLIEYDFVTGIEDVHSNQSMVNIYPNPSKGKIVIHPEDQRMINKKVMITDVLSGHIKEFQLNEQDTELSLDLPSGIYFITFSDDHESLTKKIVVE